MHHVTAALLQITVVSHYKLLQIYHKLQQNIKNYESFVANYDNVLLQVTATLSNYYTLRQLLVLLQITAIRYYKLRQLFQITTLLQITP